MKGALIFYIAIFIIGILAVPLCIIMLPIIGVWTLADSLIKAIEKRKHK